MLRALGLTSLAYLLSLGIAVETFAQAADGPDVHLPPEHAHFFVLIVTLPILPVNLLLSRV